MRDVHIASGDAETAKYDADIVIIGGGPAGMAAALGAAETNARVLIIERAPTLGGILTQCAHHGFGISYFGEELTGQEYARRFAALVADSRVEVLTDATVLSIGADRTLSVTGKEIGLIDIAAKAVILASGCRERTIGALDVAGTRPSGVMPAGAAQKMLILSGYDIGDNVVILGSGDVGLIVARELAQRGKRVVAVIEQNEHCGGMARNRKNCLERYNIPLITRATVEKIHGMPRICGVTVTDGSYIKCDTLITSIGLIPERELIDGFVKTLPEWLYVTGNAEHVYDIVDGLSRDATAVGNIAASRMRHA